MKIEDFRPTKADIELLLVSPEAVLLTVPDGAKDTVKRAVSDNARSLGLKIADWE